MSRRMYIGPEGLKVAKPGQDAYYASALDLLFSSLQSTSAPKIFCGILQGGGLRYNGFGYLGAVAGVKTTHIISSGIYTGFTAIGVPGYGGTKYADGQVCTWAAYING